MKTLYLDCGMGAAGDMLTAALIELLPDPDKFIEEINHLGLPHTKITRESVTKCGICGTSISVKIHGHEEDNHHHSHDHAHHHSQLHDIKHIVHHLNLPEKVSEDILSVYTLIAEAESEVHGVPVSDIHFHEVGTLDAVADITAVCLLMNHINCEEVVVSPVHVGSGNVHCAHGILPVPAPATAHILKGVPIYGGRIQSELCTPTGAALLKHFATRFGDMPVMNITAIGYGMGKKDFDTANCVRAMLGETTDERDKMYELSCNVDDMTAEKIAYATEQLFIAGAVDVYTIPIGMKKSRPGILICAICSQKKKEQVTRSFFKYTTTCGIRKTIIQRSILNRNIVTIDTKYGSLRRKDYSGYGVKRSKFEYEDLARIASEHNMSIDELLDTI